MPNNKERKAQLSTWAQEQWVVTFKVIQPHANMPEASEQFLGPFVFDGFEKAKACFRAQLKKLIQSDNPIFDKDGKIIELSEYADRLDRLLHEGEYGYCSFPKQVKYVLEKLGQACLGNDVLRKKTIGATDWMIWVNLDANGLNIYGFDDGPMNGCIPDIRTNIFDMREEKDYYLVVDPVFGQDFGPPKLFAYLMKVRGEENGGTIRWIRNDKEAITVEEVRNDEDAETMEDFTSAHICT